MKAPSVFVVDDEAAVADALALLLRSAGLSARTFGDAPGFLAEVGPDEPGCLLLDVRMPKMSGLELQQELNRRRYTLPVIFITGHGDVPMAVEAMRTGAFDFLQKPFNDEQLLSSVHKALAEDARERQLLGQREELRRRWAELTPREQEVARRVVDGQANKVIALELDISDRTVELHRAHAMQKLGARSLAQLVQMALVLRQAQAEATSPG